MRFTDHLAGSFEFDTKLSRNADNTKWVASALGVKVEHFDQSQAVNDLNQILDEKIARMEIVPDQG